MLNVNTIEFAGRKAVINSYSDHPLLVDDMNKQRETWAARFPNAIVKTERLSEIETMRLVALDNVPLESLAWDIGRASNA